MKHLISRAALATFTTFITLATLMITDAAHAQPADSGRMLINGVNYYHETHGTGKPLLLLHGGLGSGDMFDPVLAHYTKSRKVILVDLQGHGRTALGERPFSLQAIGDDMATLTKRLGYETIDVMGYSFGGGVAFQMAVQHPQQVSRLVLVSAGYSADAFLPDIKAQQVQVGAAMADMLKETPMYQSYVAVAPKKEDFPRLLQTMGDYMRQPYDFSADIPKLTMPVLLVFGDADMYRMEHVIDFYKKLGGNARDAGWMRETISRNRLAILSDATHYDIFLSPRLAQSALLFLEGRTDTQDWTAKQP
jgi:pimeloyl-ACP methyl ester carboxylesterase